MSDELKARLDETRSAKVVRCVMGCGFESKFTPEYRHAEGCEAYRPNELAALRARLTALQEERDGFREVLESIAAIEDKITGGDWDEIEAARTIALRALSQSEGGGK